MTKLQIAVSLLVLGTCAVEGRCQFIKSTIEFSKDYPATGTSKGEVDVKGKINLEMGYTIKSVTAKVFLNGRRVVTGPLNLTKDNEWNAVAGKWEVLAINYNLSEFVVVVVVEAALQKGGADAGTIAVYGTATTK